MRGKEEKLHTLLETDGITPAYAGKSEPEGTAADTA